MTQSRLLALSAVSLLLASPLAIAAAQRTFVSVAGSDAATCTIAQPCRSFARAISQTSPDGEVIVLDSAGYGPVAINQSVSIIAPPGVYAGISVVSATPTANGITVGGAGIKVVLRGLTINGLFGTPGGNVGIEVSGSFNGSTLVVEDCEIANMTDEGIDLFAAPNSKVTVRRTVLRNNGAAAIAITATSGSLRVAVENSAIADTVYGLAATAVNAGTRLTTTVTRSTVARTFIGLQASAGAGAVSAILSGGNTVTEADTAFKFTGSGGTELIYTPANNVEGFNTTPVAGGSLSVCCGL